ncbi:MAG TPA: OmpA family protein, partial [Terriglobales bacterium]
TFGPSFRIPMQGVSPFGLATFGVNRLAPNFLPSRLGFGFVGGGGFDLDATRHFSIRIFEAEYEYAHQSFFPLAQRVNSGGAKLSGGLVFKLGSIGPPPPPPAMSCSASPTEVFAGEPITVTANAQNFNPKRTLTYSWTSTGGKVGGNSATTQVDTNGLSAGSYTVSGHVTDGKKGMADCTASFTVKQQRPPTISCSANPTTVKPGDTVTVSCQGASPDNRNITYAYKSSAGEVSGNGPSATLNTQNVQPGTVTVTGTATDDRGLSASSDTSVTVEAPPPPPPPPAQASKINQIDFPDTRKPWRVDNTAKAVLDDVALRMQREPDSRLVIVGNTDPSDRTESRRANLSAERAVDTKFYLTNDKGIDPARIEVRSGGTGGKTAEMWIVPAGATYNGPGTAVDESKLKPVPDNPAPKAKARRRTTRRKAPAR